MRGEDAAGLQETCLDLEAASPKASVSHGVNFIGKFDCATDEFC